MFVTLVWIVILATDKQRDMPRRFLAFFFFISFLNYLAHASFFLHEYELFAFLDNLWVFTSLSGYPLYYCYLRLLTKDSRIYWKWVLVLVPAIAMSLFSFAIYFLMSPQELHIFIHQVMYHEQPLSATLPLLVRLQILRLLLFKWIFALQLLWVVPCGFRLITNYDKRLVHFYSDTQGRKLQSFKTLIIGFLFASFISILSSSIGKDFFIENKWMVIIPSVLHTVFLSWVAYAGYMQRFTIADFNRDIQTYRKERHKMAEETETLPIIRSDLAQQLARVLSEEKLFTDPNLKISDLALRLNTNRCYISRAINVDMNTDFCSWVNNYRVDYAKRLMNDTDRELSIETVAEMSGFSNLTNFYRVFKKHTGVTPGHYRKQKKR